MQTGAKQESWKNYINRQGPEMGNKTHRWGARWMPDPVGGEK